MWDRCDRSVERPSPVLEDLSAPVSVVDQHVEDVGTVAGQRVLE